uniref:C3H1-type domain-containing protein n=1 Tax=Trichobilharzia regenti TaxID=157069 RepID=A0AA85J4A3_TRIRE|nr:unnamed protein product [Trichobilharzia regenti]
MAKQICPFYLRNRCVYGDRCINLHCQPDNRLPVQSQKSPPPCKFYLRGYCHNGDSCTFSHSGNVSSRYIYQRSTVKQFPDTNYSGSCSQNRSVDSQRNQIFTNKVINEQHSLSLSRNRSNPVSKGFSFRQTVEAMKQAAAEEEKEDEETKENDKEKIPAYIELGYEAYEVYSDLDQLNADEVVTYSSDKAFFNNPLPLYAPPESLCLFS